MHCALPCWCETVLAQCTIHCSALRESTVHWNAVGSTAWHDMQCKCMWAMHTYTSMSCAVVLYVWHEQYSSLKCSWLDCNPGEQCARFAVLHLCSTVNVIFSTTYIVSNTGVLYIAAPELYTQAPNALHCSGSPKMWNLFNWWPHLVGLLQPTTK